MPDNPKKRDKADRRRVSLKQPYEVHYWTARFGVSKAVLENAVAKVGHMAKAVERYLRNNPPMHAKRKR